MKVRALASAALLLSASIGNAIAQVPPHVPGMVCFTPEFWCWAQPPGPPDTACSCYAAWGWVAGVRG